VASIQTTEELAVAAYRLRKALSSHNSTKSSPRVSAVDDAQPECEDEDDNKEKDDLNSTPTASPTFASMPVASAPRYIDESSSAVADAEKLRRFVGKHIA
jgi:hypothetical protein